MAIKILSWHGKFDYCFPMTVCGHGFLLPTQWRGSGSSRATPAKVRGLFFSVTIMTMTRRGAPLATPARRRYPDARLRNAYLRGQFLPSCRSCATEGIHSFKYLWLYSRSRLDFSVMQRYHHYRCLGALLCWFLPSTLTARATALPLFYRFWSLSRPAGVVLYPRWHEESHRLYRNSLLTMFILNVRRRRSRTQPTPGVRH